MQVLFLSRNQFCKSFHRSPVSFFPFSYPCLMSSNFPSENHCPCPTEVDVMKEKISSLAWDCFRSGLLLIMFLMQVFLQILPVSISPISLSPFPIIFILAKCYYLNAASGTWLLILYLVYSWSKH